MMCIFLVVDILYLFLLIFYVCWVYIVFGIISSSMVIAA